jgi:hypothetical protein
VSGMARLRSWSRRAAAVLRPAPARGPEPGWPPSAPDGAEAGRPAFTPAEEARLRALAGHARGAGPGALQLGDLLADRMRSCAPDLPDAALARAALAVLAFAQDEADGQDCAEDALQVLADAMRIAPVQLAAVELDLGLEEVRRWR